ncbi:LTA synthase family protein, partial [Clostridium sp.]|uniref:LTA synthase family protein n=1 Tax=Clostridium sp. TaxID=1506 RepID=UPI0034644C01
LMQTNLNTNPSKVTSSFWAKLKDTLQIIKTDKIFKYTFIALFIKTVIFLLLISDDKAVGVNFRAVLFSAPPIIAYFSFISIFLSFSYLFKKKFHLWSYTFLNVLLTIIYIGDIWYYRSNHSFLNYHMLSYTSNLDNLGESVFAMARPVDILFVIDIFLIIFLSIRNIEKYRDFKRDLKGFLLLFIVPTLYLTYAHYKIDIYGKAYENQFLFRKAWAQNQTMTNLTPIGYHIYDLYDFYKESKPYVLTEEEKKEAEDWIKNKNENIPDNEYKGMFKGKNLIVLQVESLENFIIGQSINGQEITPNLNKIIKNSFYFNNFHEQTHNGTTSDGELITNTSVLPVRSGATFFRYPTNTYENSLPNIMKRMGYKTLAAHPDKGSYWNWLQSLKSIGFDECLDSSKFNQDHMIGLGLSDESFLKQLSEVIEKQPEPFFNFSITLTSHTPFSLPEEDKELTLPTELNDHMVGKFMQTARYTDKHIGLFLDELDKKGILDNTVVVIYGDHEGVNKFFGDEVKNIENGEPWFQGNDLRVPLIIYSKDLQGKTIETLGGQVDTLPTLAYLFGAEKEDYAYTSMGRNLLNTEKDFAVLNTRRIKSNNMSIEEQNEMLKAIDLSDKLIRANYFKKE